MKVYQGIREPVCHVRVLDAAPDGAPAPASRTTLLVGPAHDGGRELAVPRELVGQLTVAFDWGADGPAAHYLAIALLADLLGMRDRGAIKSALPFMRRFLSRLPKEDFEMCEGVLRAFLHAAGPQQSALPAPPVAPAPNDGSH